MSVELTQAGQVAAPAENGEGVTSLVRMAIEKGVDVEVLERLVALQERVTERNARAAYFEALAHFQDECPEIPKNKIAAIATKSGARFNYSYAPLESITRTIRPALKANGLSYTWDVGTIDAGLLVAICTVRHVEGHSECSSFPVPIDKSSRMSDAQASGAALTYGKRQSLIAVLGLTTADEDVDGADVRSRNGAGDEQLSDDQVANLSALIDEVKANRPKFLKYMGVESLDAIPPHEYQRAVQALEAKRSA